MILPEIVESKKEALKVEEVARILGVSIKQIYRLAAKGRIPSLKVASSVRFDPHDIATWLREQSRTARPATRPMPDLSASRTGRRHRIQTAQRI